MRTLITVAILSIVLNPNLPFNKGVNSKTSSSSIKKEKGWTPLFDGKTKKGWHIYQNQGDGSDWQVLDGTLCLNPSNQPQAKKGGDMITDGVYKNFHLVIDWKISAGGNSGIFIGVQDDPKYPNTYSTGLEMQVLDNDGHDDGKIIRHRAGDLYDLISCNKETVKPVGEWNHAEIILKDDQLKLFLNGKNVVSTTLWDENWNNLIKGSKFAKMPDFATFKSGHIALQDHGNSVCYKNIKIKEL